MGLADNIIVLRLSHDTVGGLDRGTLSSDRTEESRLILPQGEQVSCTPPL